MTVKLQVVQGATTVQGSGPQSTMQSGAVTGTSGIGSITGTTPTSYTWAISVPAGSSTTLDDTDSATVTFTPDVAGIYVLELTDQSSTVYTLPLQVATVTPIYYSPGPFAPPYCAPSAVPTPAFGVALFCDSTNSGALSAKRTDGTTHAVTFA